ncbi:MAG: carboxylating nicotinate-nucleotide diphosphorylase [Propionibacteriaceae bacterium]|jgi:nicotinate-nucleotide pyrophosphorylase (carboxylating)|nr:carboxylating nicotinate-nucleotide diphosphorylase [Propionibacteriaceae bacterium]
MPVPSLLVEPQIRAALAEDLGRVGDITTNATIDTEQRSKVVMAAREPGVVAGIECARIAFSLLDPTAIIEISAPDGSAVAPGDVVMTVTGQTRALLSAERVALNFVGHLSGVATATNSLVKAVAHTKARIVDTRKTLPGLRALEKAAVFSGGGVNHRFGLDDAVLIKDNHIAAAGSLTRAVEKAKAAVGHLVKIEVEVDTLEQLRELLATEKADAVLLDNMSPETLREAVELVDGRLTTEASGKVTIENVAAIAESGVDLISSGWITHSAKNLDLGLDYVS